MPKYTNVDDLFIAKFRDKFDLLLVTATPVEMQVLHEHLKPLPGQDTILKIVYRKHTYFIGMFGAFFAVHAPCDEMGSMGRHSSMITVGNAIIAWAPSTVIMVGIAFGADEEKQAIGDVLVAERIFSYEQQRIGEEVISRGKELPASSLLVDRFQHVTDWEMKIEGRAVKVDIGLMVSGEKLVDDPEFKASLLAMKPEAIGGEMEGPGVYNACDNNVDHVILVKGICDFADGGKKFKKKERQEIAITTAVSLCEHVFSDEFAFKDAGLFRNDGVLSTDFTVEHGGIPGWMLQREKMLRKEIRHED
jgi:nucleoside phosphorylase